jgi:putative spermidine/putrescine transport system permease protein
MAIVSNRPLGSVLFRAGLVTFCTLVFLFLIAPILVIVPLSFNAEPYFTYPMSGLSLRWYEDIFGDGLQAHLWQRAALNSAIVAVCSTVLAVILGTLAALGMWRATFPLKGLVYAILISPMIVPIIVTAIGMYYFFASVGLVGSLAGIILAHTALGAPFVLITVTATLTGFDRNLVRAGSILGASPMRVRERCSPMPHPGTNLLSF